MKTVAKSLLTKPDGKLLILYRSATHPNFAGHPDLPGGEVDGTELYTEAIAREIAEETGLKVAANAPQQVLVVNHPTVDHLLYTVQIKEEEPVIVLSWEHDDYKWLSCAELLQQPIPQGADQYLLDVLSFLRESDLAN